MNQVIVTTTINAPTEAIERFDAMTSWTLIVVGDMKTPPDYHLARGRYVPPDEQVRYDPELSEAIGWNCIQRRNIGILLAYEEGADVVALVDDDNIPLDDWGQDLLVGRDVPVTMYESGSAAFDPVGATNYPHLWHRGFPRQLVARRCSSRSRSTHVQVDVQADFWNGDPDVDAACRIRYAPECLFDPTVFPICGDAPAPFDSQNTFLSRNVLPYYFLFPGIGRMDDIWASYFVQAVGFRVVFAKPSVYQRRNPHDLDADMELEVLGERNVDLFRDLAKSPRAIRSYLPARAVRAWELYRRHFGDPWRFGDQWPFGDA